MAKEKETREISRQERVTGKAPVDESVKAVNKDSREHKVKTKGD